MTRSRALRGNVFPARCAANGPYDRFQHRVIRGAARPSRIPTQRVGTRKNNLLAAIEACLEGVAIKSPQNHNIVVTTSVRCR